ncbi:MAG: DinB family protein [Bacteroidota bacterium]
MGSWSTQIDVTTQNFIETFGGLHSEQLNWKPNLQTWSIAQNIEHLILVNRSYFPIIELIRKGEYKTPFISKFSFVVSFFERTVLKAVHEDRKKKMKTFPIWEPTKNEILIDVLEHFSVHQSELKKQIEDAKELVEKGTIISSPANKNIVYRLETAFEIIVTHEKRHFEQAKLVLELKNKKNSG